LATSMRIPMLRPQQEMKMSNARVNCASIRRTHLSVNRS
jgi:hypothetical protein